MKQSRRKLLGILLTASIITATVFPMQGTAGNRDKDSGRRRNVKRAAGKPKCGRGVVEHSFRQYIALRRLFNYAG